MKYTHNSECKTVKMVSVMASMLLFLVLTVSWWAFYQCLPWTLRHLRPTKIGKQHNEDTNINQLPHLRWRWSYMLAENIHSMSLCLETFANAIISWVIQKLVAWTWQLWHIYYHCICLGGTKETKINSSNCMSIISPLAFWWFTSTSNFYFQWLWAEFLFK